MLVVEQNAAQALALSDRAYLLELGRNRLQGSGQELLQNPETRRLYLGG
jgi:branched-chain amino acid transport system ATP-binding protein